MWGLLGQLWEAFGPQDGPKLKKGRKSEFAGRPPGAKLGAKIGEKSDPDVFFDVCFVFVLGFVF